MTRSLASFGALAAALTRDTLTALIAAEAGLGHAAQVVQADAKARIGEYQDAVGAFPQWEELADATKEDRVRQGFTENDPLLRTGELRDSIVTEHHTTEAIIGSKLEIAKYQELGTDTIPPRPFLGPAAVHNSERIVEIVGSFAMAGIAGGTPIAPGLGYDG